jgi:hypothetical protein
VFETPTMLAGLVLLGWALWEQRRDPGRGATSERAERPMFCAWCMYRSGEDCTNPANPVAARSMGRSDPAPTIVTRHLSWRRRIHDQRSL